MPHALTGPLLAGILDGTVNVFYVILGVGFLIFVHELGHFAVAKWSNVRVEAFSLGFGPFIGFKRGDTEYRLSLIPLGGYVKMTGEGLPVEGEEMDPRELRSKGTLTRAAVFSAGVIMNGIAGVLLFAIAFTVGIDLAAPVVGDVEPGSAAWEAGIRPGDRIVDVDGHQPIDFDDMIQEVAYAGTDQRIEIRFERDGETHERSLRATSHPRYRLPMVGIVPRAGPLTSRIRVEAGTPAYEAGLRSDDRIVGVGGKSIESAYDIWATIRGARGSVEISVERDGETQKFTVTPKVIASKSKILGIWPYDGEIRGVRGDTVFTKGDRFVRVADAETPTYRAFAAAIRTLDVPAEAVPVVVLREGLEAPLTISFANVAEREEILRSLHVTDLTVPRFAYVEPPILELEDNRVAAAGIPEGATIVAVNDERVSSWTELREAIADAGEQGLHLTWRMGDGEESRSGVLEKQPSNDLVLGLRQIVHKEKVREDLGTAIVVGFQRSVLMGKRVIQTIGGIIGGSISGRNLGGPIMIFSAASAYAEQGLMDLFLFLGLLSVNLAIINLLPIPILDGGHLVFLLIERIKGSPVRERTFALAQWVGLVLILALLVYVTFNDILRSL